MRTYLWTLSSFLLGAAACGAAPATSAPGGSESGAASTVAAPPVFEQSRGGCTPHAVECTGCTQDSSSKTGYAVICGNGCDKPTATPCTPKIDSVIFTLSGTSPGGGAWVSGSIVVYDDGSWYVDSGTVNFSESPIVGTCGDWSVSCNVAGLPLSASGCVGGQLVGNPSANLTGSGSYSGYADNWAGVVADWRKSSVVTCAVNSVF